MTTSYTYAGGDFTAWVYAYDQNWRKWTSNRVTFHVNGPANSNPTAEIISASTADTTTRRGVREGEKIDITAPLKVNRGETINFEITVDDVDTWNEHQAYIYFGDGGWMGPIAITATPQTITASHAYAGGNFAFQVYVYDDKGGYAQQQLSIEVSGEPNANPTIEITPPSFIRSGVPATFDVNISDVDTFQTPLTAYWYFGDGTWSQDQISNPFTNPVSHTYSTAGSYEVWMYVYDNHGGWAYKQLTVTSVDNSLKNNWMPRTQLSTVFVMLPMPMTTL